MGERRFSDPDTATPASESTDATVTPATVTSITDAALTGSISRSINSGAGLAAPAAVTSTASVGDSGGAGSTSSSASSDTNSSVTDSSSPPPSRDALIPAALEPASHIPPPPQVTSASQASTPPPAAVTESSSSSNETEAAPTEDRTAHPGTSDSLEGRSPGQSSNSTSEAARGDGNAQNGPSGSTPDPTESPLPGSAAQNLPIPSSGLGPRTPAASANSSAGAAAGPPHRSPPGGSQAMRPIAASGDESKPPHPQGAHASHDAPSSSPVQPPHSGFSGDSGGQQREHGGGREEVRWCCVGRGECAFCGQVVPALSIDNQRWSCVQRRSKQECMGAIVGSQAELVSLDAGLAFRAFLHGRMKAIMSERLAWGETYHAVAVVRRDVCDVSAGGRGEEESAGMGGSEGVGVGNAGGSGDGREGGVDEGGSLGRSNSSSSSSSSNSSSNSSSTASGRDGSEAPNAQGTAQGTGKNNQQRRDNSSTATATATATAHSPTPSLPALPRGPWATLHRFKTCHPLYASAAGWDLPVRALLDLGLARGLGGGGRGGFAAPPFVEGEPADVTLVKAVFPESCAPGGEGALGVSTTAGAGEAGGRGGEGSLGRGDTGRVCSGCVSVNGRGSCDEEDSYAGFHGAFRCLMEQAGDVAFLRHDVAPWFTRGGRFQQPWSLQALGEFRLLCPPMVGGCMEFTDNLDATNCTLGRVPANVVMTRNAISERFKRAIIARLELAGTVKAWREALYEGSNPFDYVLSGSAKGLLRVESLTRAYLGAMGVVSDDILRYNKDHAPPLHGKATQRQYSHGWAHTLLLTLLACMLFA
ncbi:hypothetical protein CLOM_g22224 [Closterium sp. NIES-68]|nr:hypothetical protein CLOM_g22224 [Closterium sp. NIES-68]